jgi:hypothetical protein
MNTANPAPRSSYFWPASGTRDPAFCQDAASTTDPGCAYDYGWHAAANAFATAQSASGAALGAIWWLDVETGNTWNGDGYSNAADIQGSIDYLRSKQVASVGVYSTDYQWTSITGGYRATNASSYASAWQPEFTSPNGIGSSPSWLAGAASEAAAASSCGSSFLNTTTWLTQYPSGGYDGDYSCGSTSPPPQPNYAISASPASVVARVGTAARVAITLASGGGWQGSVTLHAASSSSVKFSLTQAQFTVPGNATLTLSDNTPGTYKVTVTATPTPGSSSSSAKSTTIVFTVKPRR